MALPQITQFAEEMKLIWVAVNPAECPSPGFFAYVWASHHFESVQIWGFFQRKLVMLLIMMKMETRQPTVCRVLPLIIFQLFNGVKAHFIFTWREKVRQLSLNL